MKCRLKKALDLECLKAKQETLTKENRELKDALSRTSMVLASKLEENEKLTIKLEEVQDNQTKFLLNLMSKNQEG
mgnify:CR=1 FL=1